MKNAAVFALVLVAILSSASAFMPPAFAPSRTFALEAGGGRGKEKVKVRHTARLTVVAPTSV